MSEVYASIKYTIESTLSDEERWLTKINGVITANEDDVNYVEVGRVVYYHVDIESAMKEDGISPHDLLDTCRSTYSFHYDLYDVETLSFKESFLEIIGYGGWSRNILIIDRIEILPEYRGEGLAKEAINEAIRLFSSRADVAVLMADPLQFEPNRDSPEWDKKMRLGELEQEREKANKALVSFYEGLGFSMICKKRIMARTTE
ncbi:hypothetical protein ACFLZU_03760 [Thermodesulfobacteriota bacterium]